MQDKDSVWRIKAQIMHETFQGFVKEYEENNWRDALEIKGFGKCRIEGEWEAERGGIGYLGSVCCRIVAHLKNGQKIQIGSAKWKAIPKPNLGLVEGLIEVKLERLEARSVIVKLKDYLFLAFSNGAAVTSSAAMSSKPSNKRDRGISADVLKGCEIAMKEWLGNSKTLQEAADLGGVNDQTVLKHIPEVLEIIDEPTRRKWIRLIKTQKKEKYLGKFAKDDAKRI